MYEIRENTSLANSTGKQNRLLPPSVWWAVKLLIVGLLITVLHFTVSLYPLLSATFLYVGIALACAGVFSLMAKAQKPYLRGLLETDPDFFDIKLWDFSLAYHAIRFFLLGMSHL